MQTRILNLPDALRLSTLLGKYITKVPEGNISNFFDSLFDKFAPEDLFVIIYLLTGEKLKADVSGDEVVKVFYEGLMKNKVVTLIETSKEVGLI